MMRYPTSYPFAERLTKEMEGRNVSAFARQWNIPGGVSMIYQHKKGLKPVGIDAALAYARAFDISIHEIIPELAVKLSRVQLYPSGTNIPGRVPVPTGRLRVQAGTPGFEFDEQASLLGQFHLDGALMRERGINAAKLYAIPVDDREMEPTLVIGSIVIINTADTRCKDGGVFAINRAGRVVIRRLLKQGSAYVFSCDNTDLHDDQNWPLDERCIVIGRVFFHYGEVP